MNTFRKVVTHEKGRIGVSPTDGVVTLYNGDGRPIAAAYLPEDDLLRHANDCINAYLERRAARMLRTGNKSGAVHHE